MERTMIQNYKRRFLKEHPDGFFYKIPDGWAETKEGHRYGSNKPFDVFAIANGICYCLVARIIDYAGNKKIVEATRHCSVAMCWRGDDSQKVV
jgi:hypothetical protein